jgi:cyanophycin synthetase
MRLALDPHQRALVHAAERLGVEAIIEPDIEEHPFVPTPADAVTYRRNGASTRIIHGRIFEQLTPKVDALCADKARAKRFLEELGLPTPKDLLFRQQTPPDVRADMIEAFLSATGAYAYVVKPLDGTNGEDVYMDLRSSEKILWRVSGLLERGEDVLLEEQAPGQDLRVQVVGRTLVAACIREPAYVTGDGHSTIAELAAEKDLLVQQNNPQNRLLLDEESLRLLSEQDLSPASILARDQKIFVKRVANIGLGGLPVDVTDALHPDYHSWCERIAEALGLDIFALDLIANDAHSAPDKSGAVILEINAQPQWLHHTFSQARTHDIPALLFDALLGTRA